MPTGSNKFETYLQTIYFNCIKIVELISSTINYLFKLFDQK